MQEVRNTFALSLRIIRQVGTELHVFIFWIFSVMSVKNEGLS